MPTTIEYSPIDYDTGKLLDPVKFVITDYEAAIEGSHLAERIQREYRRSLIKMCDKCKFLKGASYHTCEVCVSCTNIVVQGVTHSCTKKSTERPQVEVCHPAYQWFSVPGVAPQSIFKKNEFLVNSEIEVMRQYFPLNGLAEKDLAKCTKCLEVMTEKTFRAHFYRCYPCTNCFRYFTNACHYENCHKTEPVDVLICPVCFISVERLLHHFEKMHEKVPRLRLGNKKKETRKTISSKKKRMPTRMRLDSKENEGLADDDEPWDPQTLSKKEHRRSQTSKRRQEKAVGRKPGRKRRRNISESSVEAVSETEVPEDSRTDVKDNSSTSLDESEQIDPTSMEDIDPQKGPVMSDAPIQVDAPARSDPPARSVTPRPSTSSTTVEEAMEVVCDTGEEVVVETSEMIGTQPTEAEVSQDVTVPTVDANTQQKAKTEMLRFKEYLNDIVHSGATFDTVEEVIAVLDGVVTAAGDVLKTLNIKIPALDRPQIDLTNIKVFELPFTEGLTHDKIWTVSNFAWKAWLVMFSDTHQDIVYYMKGPTFYNYCKDVLEINEHGTTYYRDGVRVAGGFHDKQVVSILKVWSVLKTNFPPPTLPVGFGVNFAISYT